MFGPGSLLIAMSGAAALAPVLTAINYDIADTAGGDSVTLTGTNLTGATCTVGGTSATVTANTSTSVTFTMPAKSAGTYAVQVTTAGGPSNMISIEAWSPAQLATGVQDTFLDASKGVTVSAGKVSSWASQGATARVCSQGTVASQPVQTSSVFGARPGITFDGSDDSLVTPADIGPIATYSSFAVARWTSAKTTINTTSSNVPLTIAGSRGWGGFGASAGQVAWKNYDKPIQLQGVGLNNDIPHLIGVTCSATAVRLYADGTQLGTDFTPGDTNAYLTRIGGGRYVPDATLGDDFFAGHLGAVLVVAGVISGADLSRLYRWARSHLGVP